LRLWRNLSESSSQQKAVNRKVRKAFEKDAKKIPDLGSFYELRSSLRARRLEAVKGI